MNLASKKTTIDHSFSTLNEITLPPEHKNLELEFATTNYLKPLLTNYSYKIEGLQEDWIDLGAKNNLSLNGLPSGNYILKLKGIDHKGHWSKNTIALKLHVDDFFYNELWFYVLILSSVILIAVVIILFLNKRIKKATQKIRKDKLEIEQQAQQLGELDKAKNEFFTNITHEFKTP